MKHVQHPPAVVKHTLIVTVRDFIGLLTRDRSVLNGHTETFTQKLRESLATATQFQVSLIANSSLMPLSSVDRDEEFIQVDWEAE